MNFVLKSLFLSISFKSNTSTDERNDSGKKFCLEIKFENRKIFSFCNIPQELRNRRIIDCDGKYGGKLIFSATLATTDTESGSTPLLEDILLRL